MRNSFQVPMPHAKALAVGTIIMTVAALTISAIPFIHKAAAAPNIFSLVGSLHHTTSNILANTRALQRQVDNVESQLADLTKQEQILSRQTVTGHKLALQLQTQVSLTQENVGLMRKILRVEQSTASVTALLRQKSDVLSKQIDTNANVLSGLAGTLQTTNRESSIQNAEMDRLLQELQTSSQEFRVFGQVNQLLSGLNPTSGGTGSAVTNTLGAVSNALNQSGSPLGSAISPLENAGSSSSSPSSAIGSLANSVTSGVSGLTTQSSKSPTSNVASGGGQSLLGLLP